MSKIEISDLCPAGAGLFVDDESLMVDLKDNELSITGGKGGSKSKKYSNSFSFSKKKLYPYYY